MEEQQSSRYCGHGGHDPERPVKRRKIALACDECRSRKVRCDGGHPVCGACSKRSDLGVQCVYSVDPEKKRTVHRNYVISLENKIKDLERERGYLQSSVSGTRTRAREQPAQTPNNFQTHEASAQDFVQPNSSFAHTLASPLSYQDGQAGDSPARFEASQLGYKTLQPSSGRYSICNQSQSPHSPISTQERQPNSEEAFDGVNAMMGAVEEERATQGFFGSSSAASFMRQIKIAVEEKVASPEWRTSESVLGSAPRSTLMSTRTSQPKLANYVLPPRKTADGLMEVYWNLVFPLYPLVDRAQLSSAYEKIWTGENFDYDENMLMCTFNVIFALSCQLSEVIKPEEREASADVFFSRAKELLQFSLWHSGSAELIQCLLLMGQYLQSTNSAHQCWIVVGLAIRNAQSLGLHLPQTICSFQSFQEQQLARKIWYGCVLMDRVVSMTFGRPAMISKGSGSAVPLPATIDEEFITSSSGGEVSQPANRPSMMTFFARSLELYEILNDILLNLYMPSPEESPEDIHDFYFHKESKIFELDRALTKWSRKLPPHLRDSSSEASADPIFCRQAIVLRARFLHVRMLLFRPTLARYCTAREVATEDQLISLNDSFPQRVALQCSIICVKVAQEVIELIFNNTPSDGSTGSLPAWWYNILYVYTAATVLIAGRLRPAILSEVTECAITRSWNCALEILRKYQDYSTSARRCVAALEILYERVVSEGRPSRIPQNDQQVQNIPVTSASNALNDMSLGEGMNAAVFDSFNLPDMQDMSWLNSVPSNLY